MRSDDALLLDMLLAARQIIKFMGDLTQAEFETDARTQSAVIRELIVIGEAARVLPDEAKARYPAVNWRGIRDMRNALVHVYFAVDLSVVWDTVALDIPELIEQLDRPLSSI